MTARIPLVVGVAGETLDGLDETERDALRASLRDRVFVPLMGGESSLPSNARTRWVVNGKGGREQLPLEVHGTPLRLLTSLVTDGDRLIVRAALEAARLVHRPDDVEVVLLWPDGRRLTPSPGDPELDAILRKTLREIELPDATARGTAAGVAADDRQLALADLTIARWARLVVAVWEGRATDSEPLPGGTRSHARRLCRLQLESQLSDPFLAADAAHLERQGGDDVFGFAPESLDFVDVGPVVAVAPSDSTTVRMHTPTVFAGDPKPFYRYYDEVLERLGSFNRDVVDRHSDLAAEIGRNADYLLDSGKANRLDVHERRVRSLFATADTLANFHQARARRAYRLIYLAAVAAGASFVAYGHAFLHSPVGDIASHVALGLYLLLLFLAGLVFEITRVRGSEWRHWDYRALAEGLRVQFHWYHSGVRSPASRHYLHRQRNELDWVRAALEAVGLAAVPQRSGCSDAVRLDESLDRWVTDQFGYYQKQHHVRSHKAIACHAAGAGLLAASVIASAWALFAHLHGFWIVLAASFLAFLAAGAATAAFARLVLEHRFETLHLQRKKWWIRGPKVQVARPAWLLVLLFGVLGLGVGLVVSLPLQAWTPHGLWSELRSDHHSWAVIGMALPAILAALLHSWARQRAYEDERTRFGRMRGTYGDTIHALSDLAGDPRVDELQHPDEATRKAAFVRFCKSSGKLALQPRDTSRLLRTLGQESLIEHAEWVLLHRARPIDLPHAM